MIKFEYDPQTDGCKVSFLLLDSDHGQVPTLCAFDIDHEASRPLNRAMVAKQSPHNLLALADMLTKLSENQ